MPRRRNGGSVWAAIRQHPRAFGEIIGLRLVELLTMSIVTTFAVAYGVTHLGMPRERINVALIVGGLGIGSIPTSAYLSDRIGWRKNDVIGSLVAAAFA